jgi:hypothetical protein
MALHGRMGVGLFGLHCVQLHSGTIIWNTHDCTMQLCGARVVFCVWLGGGVHWL